MQNTLTESRSRRLSLGVGDIEGKLGLNLGTCTYVRREPMDVWLAAVLPASLGTRYCNAFVHQMRRRNSSSRRSWRPATSTVMMKKIPMVITTAMMTGEASEMIAREHMKKRTSLTNQMQSLKPADGLLQSLMTKMRRSMCLFTVLGFCLMIFVCQIVCLGLFFL